jgi:hypothetical protein
MVNKKFSLQSSAYWLIFILPILVFFLYLLVYSLNLPYRDDYTITLLFLNHFVDAHSIGEKINLIFHKHYGQILFYPHIVSLIMYKVAGFVNFKWLMFIGNLGLVAIIFSIYKGFKFEKNKVLFFLPAVFLLFQQMYSEGIFQANASMGNFNIVAFGVLSLLFIVNYRNSWLFLILALVSGALSFLTQVNGFIFVIVAMPILFFQKRIQDGIIWALFTIISIILYFSFEPQTGAGISFNFQRIPEYITYFFTFIGNNFGLNEGSSYFNSSASLLKTIFQILPLIAGVIITGYFLFLTFIRYYEKNPYIYGLFLFLFLTAASAAVMRIDTDGGQPVTSRYRVVTVLFLILSYLSLIEIITKEQWKRVVLAAGLVFAVGFNIFAYCLKTSPIKQHRMELVSSFLNWQKTGKGLTQLAWPKEEGTSESILADSIKRNIYKIPKDLK